MSELAEKDRVRLDGIVKQMIANGESENDIRFVVGDFKKKYTKKPVKSQQGGFLDQILGRMAAGKPLPPASNVPYIQSPTLRKKRAAEVLNAVPRKPLTSANVVSEINELTETLAGNIRSIPGVEFAERVGAGVSGIPIRPTDAIAGGVTGPLDVAADVMRFLDTGELEALGNIAVKSGLPFYAGAKVAKPVAKKVVEYLRKGKTADAKKLVENGLRDAPKFDLKPEAPKTAAKPIKDAIPGYKPAAEGKAKEPWEMTREEFKGNPRLYSGAINKAETPKKVFKSTSEAIAEPFMDGKYSIRKGEDQFAVYDGDKVIATYTMGDNLVVDPKYRRKGIASELLKAYKLERDPLPTAASRSKEVDKLYDKVYAAIQADRPGYKAGTKYNQPHVPEVTHLDPKKIAKTNHPAEVGRVSDEVAQKMDFSEPIEVTLYADGKLEVSDGNHRLAAAKQLGKTSIPVKLKVINAKGEQISALIDESNILAKAETPPKPKKDAPASPVAKSEDATGLANQVQTREVEAGILKEIPATKGKSPEELQKLGKQAFGDDYDYEGLAERIAKGEELPSAEKFGILLEGKTRLRNEVNRLANALKERPGDKDLLETYNASKERLQAFAENVQAGKGEWSEMGRALQAGTDLDTGDFAQVLEEAQRHGKVSPKMEKQFRAQTETITDLTAKLEAKEAELAEARAAGTVTRSAARKASRETIAKERESIFKEIDDIFKEASGAGLHDIGSAAYTTVKAGSKLAVAGGKLALNYAKEGITLVDEIAERVIADFKARGLEIDRQTIIDEMAAPRTSGKTKNEIEKAIGSLKAQVKRESTGNKAKIQAEIDSLQNQLKSGDFRTPSKREAIVSKELENLRAERDIYSGRVRSSIRGLADSQVKKGLKFVSANIRGTILGSDIGVLTRQGLFGLSRPIQFAKSVGKGVQATFSEKKLAQIEKNIFDHEVLPGTKAGLIYKKAGLSTTDHLTNPEELVIASIFKKIPGLGKLAGAGERFQSAFINTLRSETMDRAIRLGYSDSELAARANFINSATGRSNAKQIPTYLQVIMTSPRYERSRWEMIGHALKNPANLAKGLATGKLDKAALANVQDMAVTAAEIYGLYKLAETSGYEVDFNPTSADFLKMRKGDEVWDPTAGLAPRLRDVMRFVAWGMEPTNNQNVGRLLAGAGTRTISPFVKQPTELLSQQVQRAKGVPDDKMNSFFTGWKFDEDDKGVFTFAPLIIQTAKKYLDEGNVPGALSAAAREGIGQSVSRYPKPKRKG